MMETNSGCGVGWLQQNGNLETLKGNSQVVGKATIH